MQTKFIYMDEHYSDPNTYRSNVIHRRQAATSLTGVTVPVSIHRNFRKQYYQAVAEAISRADNVIQSLPIIHASNLFPDRDDFVKLDFLRKIVFMTIEFGLKVYRVGYYETPELVQTTGGRTGILGLCFSSLLYCLSEELAENELWPVMETDRSASQDEAFAGHIQRIDYFTALIGKANVLIDNANLGELHYSSKKSVYGAVTDCISYLLDARSLKSAGAAITPFKKQIAAIADGLTPSIVFDEIITMKFEEPPYGYRAQGPFRYMTPLVPN